MKDTILVLGGTGFIGRNIIDALKQDSHYNLVIVSRNIDQIDRTLFVEPNIVFKEGSLDDNLFIENLITSLNVNIVIHLVSNLIPSSTKKEFYEGINDVIFPTIKLIDFIAERGVRFLFFSSGGTIYGNKDFKVEETCDLNPINSYGYSKLVIENYIRFKGNTSKLKYLIFRPSNVYGEFQGFDSNQGFISVAIKKIYNNVPIEIWGDGNVIRDYIHASDVASIVRKSLDKDISNYTFNLSTGRGTSLLEVLRVIERKFNKNAKVIFSEGRTVDANAVVLDNCKLLRIINHKFVEIEEGIGKQINYFYSTLND